MTVDDKLITYLETLGRLELEEDERRKLKHDIQDILAYMDSLNELDTEGVEPRSHSLPVSNVWRPDVVENSDIHDDILQNAPNRTEDCFVVPRVVE